MLKKYFILILSALLVLLSSNLFTKQYCYQSYLNKSFKVEEYFEVIGLSFFESITDWNLKFFEKERLIQAFNDVLNLHSFYSTSDSEHLDPKPYSQKVKINNPSLIGRIKSVHHFNSTKNYLTIKI